MHKNVPRLQAGELSKLPGLDLRMQNDQSPIMEKQLLCFSGTAPEAASANGHLTLHKPPSSFPGCVQRRHLCWLSGQFSISSQIESIQTI